MSTLQLTDPQADIAQIVSFLESIYKENPNEGAAIAVSGGIDSAVSLTLVTQALANTRVFPVFLPFGDQLVEDSWAITRFNAIPDEQVTIIDIEPIVRAAAETVGLTLSATGQAASPTDHVRLGNLMARARMIVLYDLAKQKQALVCGTENKSEKYLGYFTRFGDEASDIEPIAHLYKTQVRQLAAHLGLPDAIQTKAPSAGLWSGQTDENELGFSYEVADQVLAQLIDEKKDGSEITVAGIKPEIVVQVIERVRSQAFKQLVPYHLG